MADVHPVSSLAGGRPGGNPHGQSTRSLATPLIAWIVAAVTAMVACAEPPSAPSRVAGTQQTEPGGTPASQPAGTPVSRTVEIVLSDEDPALTLAPFPYDEEVHTACAPCQVVPIAPELPSRIQLTWTADLHLYAWVEGDARDGSSVVLWQASVGIGYGALAGREMRLDYRHPWTAVLNPRLKIGLPLTTPRTLLGAPASIAVTMFF